MTPLQKLAFYRNNIKHYFTRPKVEIIRVISPYDGDKWVLVNKRTFLHGLYPVARFRVQDEYSLAGDREVPFISDYPSA